MTKQNKSSSTQNTLYAFLLTAATIAPGLFGDNEAQAQQTAPEKDKEKDKKNIVESVTDRAGKALSLDGIFGKGEAIEQDSTESLAYKIRTTEDGLRNIKTEDGKAIERKDISSIKFNRANLGVQLGMDMTLVHEDILGVGNPISRLSGTQFQFEYNFADFKEAFYNNEDTPEKQFIVGASFGRMNFTSNPILGEINKASVIAVGLNGTYVNKTMEYSLGMTYVSPTEDMSDGLKRRLNQDGQTFIEGKAQWNFKNGVFEKGFMDNSQYSVGFYGKLTHGFNQPEPSQGSFGLNFTERGIPALAVGAEASVNYKKFNVTGFADFMLNKGLEPTVGIIIQPNVFSGNNKTLKFNETMDDIIERNPTTENIKVFPGQPSFK